MNRLLPFLLALLVADLVVAEGTNDPPAPQPLRLTAEGVIGVWRNDSQQSSDVLAIGTNGAGLYIPDAGMFPVKWQITGSNRLEVASIAFTNCPSRLLCQGIMISPVKLKLEGHPVSTTWTKTESVDKVNAFQARIRMMERQPDVSRRMIESRSLKMDESKNTEGDRPGHVLPP